MIRSSLRPEIFINRGEHIWGGPPGSPEEDGDRFLEFWNLVFMQFEQVTREERVPLPKPSIDTGMGLERLAAVLQHKHNNYDIDLFRALQPDFQMNVIPGAGHWVAYEAAEAFNRKLIDVLLQ